MSKLSSMAKNSARESHIEDMNLYVEGYHNGFTAAFKVVNEELLAKLSKLEQYPMMGERIIAVKTYMKTMDDLLKEMKLNE
jgi:hypothetical protein